MNENLEQLNQLEKLLGYKFKDISILKRAVTHRSACNRTGLEHYERLEFLGDAVMGLTVSDYIYNKYPEMSEGEMSILRDKLVSEEACKIYSSYYLIDSFIIAGKGMIETSKHYKGDMFESVLGAIYIDGGLKKVVTCFNNVLSSVFDQIPDIKNRSNVSELQEVVHKIYKMLPEYIFIKEEGPDHKKVYECEVRVNGKVMSAGSGFSKKEAKETAAIKAIDYINNL